MGEASLSAESSLSQSSNAEQQVEDSTGPRVTTCGSKLRTYLRCFFALSLVVVLALSGNMNWLQGSYMLHSRTNTVSGNRNSTTQQEKPERRTEMELSFWAILSMQRSASTFLARHVILTKSNIPKEASPVLNSTAPPMSTCQNHIFVCLDEIFLDSYKQTKDAWTTEPGLSLLQTYNGKVQHIPPDILSEHVVRIAKRRCRNSTAIRGKPVFANATTTSKCATVTQCSTTSGSTTTPTQQCFVSFKAFPNQLPINTYRQIFNSLPNLTAIILERPIAEQWRSKHVAETQGDWSAIGNAQHKELVSNTTIPTIPEKFQQDHVQWYTWIREYFNLKQKQQKNQSFSALLDVTYAQVTSDPVAMRQRIVQATPNLARYLPKDCRSISTAAAKKNKSRESEAGG